MLPNVVFNSSLPLPSKVSKLNSKFDLESLTIQPQPWKTTLESQTQQLPNTCRRTGYFAHIQPDIIRASLICLTCWLIRRTFGEVVGLVGTHLDFQCPAQLAAGLSFAVTDTRTLFSAVRSTAREPPSWCDHRLGLLQGHRQ
jgi:hypothetical protein